MIHTHTFAVTKDHGPRPAGPPDECFYCQEPVGGVHKPKCVMRDRTVVVRYTYEVVVKVPEHWTKDDVEFHRNESTWCASNADHEIERMANVHGCPCSFFTAEYVREASADEDEAWTKAGERTAEES